MSEKDELDVETEEEESPYVEFDISVYPTDYTLAVLVQQYKEGDIVVPFYQRKYVWKITQASRLIESFLMGLPVPQVFMYVNDDEKCEIIDGQQRILSVAYFLDGYFGEEDAKGNRKTFRLTGLAEKSPYYNKSFTELEQKDQRKLKKSVLRAINIKQLSPQEDNDSVFHIFERLNTGGTKLTPQEVRNAVYRGNIVQGFENLNKLDSWRKLLSAEKADKHQKDVELILRVFALFKNWHSYKPPMVQFLNKAMEKDKAFSSDKAREFTVRFQEVVDFLTSGSIEKPFHPRGALSAAAIDGIMTALLESKLPSKEVFGERYKRLVENERFLPKGVSTSTTGQKLLIERIETAKRVLIDGEE